jgi:hypothetical protein
MQKFVNYKYFVHENTEISCEVLRNSHAVNAVYRNIRCVLSDPFKTHKYTVWPERGMCEGYTGGT